MKHSFLIVGSLILLPALTFAADSEVFFTKNIKLGDSSVDVLLLQKMLNSDPDTAIVVPAGSPGSKGQETQYFGHATQNAVMAFQRKYAKEVLEPAGLSYPTGFVGSLTRAKLSSLALALTVNQKVGQGTLKLSDISSVDPALAQMRGAFSDTPEGVFISKTSGRTVIQGSEFLLYGYGFTDSGNVLHLGDDRQIVDLKAESGVKIKVTIPADLPLGKRDVWVSNTKGQSNHGTLIVVTKDAKSPIIEKIEPTSGPVGAQVVITGQNFSQNHNDIETPYGIISDVASTDGKTLKFSFSYPPLAKLQELKNAGKKVNDLDLPIVFGVVNDNGYSSEKISFKVVIRKTN